MPEALTLSLPENQPLPAQQEQAEALKQYGITDVAQSYGLAQAEVERQLINSDPANWTQVAQDTLNHYPALQAYGEIFMGGVKGMVQVREAIGQVWQAAQEKVPEEAAPDGTDPIAAGPALSEELFGDFVKFNEVRFGKGDFVPLDPVVAEKGNALWFSLSGRDLSRYLGEGKAGITFKYGLYNDGEGNNFSIPVVITSEDADPVTITHEARHARVGILKTAYMKDSEALDISEQVTRFLGESPFEAGFKEELEAYFSKIEIYDAHFESVGAERILPEKCLESLTRITEGLFKSMTEKDGVYSQNAYTAKPGEVNYVKPPTLEEALEAMKGLVELREFNIDQHSFVASMADTASIKTLRLFPLRQWPTVVKVIKDKNTALRNTSSS